MEYPAVSLPWHADQPHLAEWQAFSAREMLFHLDQTVDARSMAQAQAKKRASHLVQDDAEDDGPAPDTRRFVIEDNGGAPADLDDGEPPVDLGCEKHELRFPPNRIALVLSRAAERAENHRPGRTRNAHTDMWSVADTFSDVLDSIQLPFPTQSGQDDGGIGRGIADAIEHQAAVAERIRKQQNPEDAACSEDVACSEDDIGASALPAVSLTEAAALLLQGQGPLELARALARAATLNADQMSAVALVANAMQKTWEEQGRPEHAAY